MIDGNDADVVYREALKAFDKARSGGGPSLIECLTYRHSGHSRADPAKYRPKEELEAWMKRDPVVMYRARLLASGMAAAQIEALESEAMRTLEAATEAARGHARVALGYPLNVVVVPVTETPRGPTGTSEKYLCSRDAPYCRSIASLALVTR